MQLYFATGNTGKVDDAQEILADVDVDVEQMEVDVMEPQDAALEDVARFKVEQALEDTQLFGSYLMADDSGLFVPELDGFPGILSSPFDAQVGKEKLLDLVDVGTAAAFRAAIALHDPETGTVEVFTGEVEGTLVEPRGDGGFGYDPMFLPDGNEKTFAEDMAYKHKVSHRREALEGLHDRIRDDG
ncbi:MAG: non-canonical purine NTP pyrophosphatase [Candidatus Nanohaloarchaea archaeon]|nr:non-canonical purine NTP pyrophosphatase [Candidatus Nanohaloarchaea archaeon]